MQEAELTIAPARLVSIEALNAMLGASLTGALFLLAVTFNDKPASRLDWVLALAAFAFVSLFYLRRGGAIRADGKVLIVPGRIGRRAKRLDLAAIRAVFQARRGLISYVLIDDGKRLLGIPAKRFSVPDPAGSVRALVLATIAAMPEAPALTAALNQGCAFSQQLERRRTPAAQGIALLTIVLAGSLTVFRHEGDRLALLNLGALAPPLAWNGEWFRAATAAFFAIGLWHALIAALATLILGSALERLAGTRTMLTILGLTSFGGYLTAAFIGSHIAAGFLLAGIWPGVAGLAGALMMIAGRMGKACPANAKAGARLPGAGAWILIAAFRLVARGNLSSALPGLALGLLLGRLFSTGPRRMNPRLDGGVLVAEASWACAALYAVSLGAAVLHGWSPAQRLADRMSAVHALTSNPRLDPMGAVQVVRTLAWDGTAHTPLLRAGMRLASKTADMWGEKYSEELGVDDAMEVLERRLQNPAPPPDLDSALFWPPEPRPSYFAKLAGDLAAQGSPAIFGGDGVTAPSLRLIGGTIEITSPGEVSQGARLYALVRDAAGGIAGMLFIVLPPGFSGSQVLPVPASFGAPLLSPPPLWTDAGTRLQLAVFDHRPCDCAGEVMGPSFYPVAEAGAQ